MQGCLADGASYFTTFDNFRRRGEPVFTAEQLIDLTAHKAGSREKRGRFGCRIIDLLSGCPIWIRARGQPYYVHSSSRF